MALTPRKLRALVIEAAASPVRDEQAIDQFLRDHGIRDVESRIAFKIELAAQGGELATDQGPPAFDLMTDRPGNRYTPATPRLSPDMAHLMRRAGITLDRAYSEGEINTLLDAAQLDVTSRIAIKHTLLEHQLMHASTAPQGRGLQAGRRDIRAAADPDRRVLRNADGSPRTLRFV